MAVLILNLIKRHHNFSRWFNAGARPLLSLSWICLCMAALEALMAAADPWWFSHIFLTGLCFTIISRLGLSLCLCTAFFPMNGVSETGVKWSGVYRTGVEFPTFQECAWKQHSGNNRFCSGDLLRLALPVQGVNDRVAYRVKLRNHPKMQETQSVLGYLANYSVIQLQTPLLNSEFSHFLWH